LLLPVIFIGTVTVSVSINYLISILLPDFNLNQEQQLGLPPIGDSNLLTAGIFLVVAVPLVEEFIFRGYLYGILRRYASFLVTTIVVSLIWAVLHVQINVIIDIFIFSLAICYVREKTGSIWTGVALHSLKNFIAFLLLFVFKVV
jgi:membrane protease YdiL (CAAX protease family)